MKKVAVFEPVEDDGRIYFRNSETGVMDVGPTFIINDKVELPEDKASSARFMYETREPEFLRTLKYEVEERPDEEEEPPPFSEIVSWNEDQNTHVEIVQRLCLMAANFLMEIALGHDKSKFSNEEYATFINSKSALDGAEKGPDKDYKEWCTSNAIRHHVQNNRHHPEFWDAISVDMPFLEVVIMYFDWVARTLQRGGDYEDFREYNMAKLTNQPTARAIILSLEKQFPAGSMVWNEVRSTIEIKPPSSD